MNSDQLTSLSHTPNEGQKPSSYFGIDRSEMLSFVPPRAQKVLEIGCGRGGFGALLKSRLGAEVHGVEIHEPSAQQAAKVLDKVYTGSLESIVEKLPSHTYDTVICNDVLEHFAYPDQVLAQLKRCLSPGAVIVASIPNVRHIGNLFHLLIQKDWKYMDSGIRDNTHLRFFTQKSIQRLFESCGYHIELLHGICPSRHPAFSLFNILTFGFFADTRYFQFAVRAKLSASHV